MINGVWVIFDLFFFFYIFIFFLLTLINMLIALVVRFISMGDVVSVVLSQGTLSGQREGGTDK